MIRQQEQAYSVTAMCAALAVNRSGYYVWRDRPPSRRERENERLLVQIRVVHEQSRRTYGSPRMTDALRAQGERCNEKRVARLMRQAGIRPKTVKKFTVTTDSRHEHPVAPNRLNRAFTAQRPNQVWLSDITYVWTAEGWLYLAAVLDVYSRKIVGWALSEQIDGSLTEAALQQAAGRRQPGPGLLHHSDRGVQYACGDYQKLLGEWEMIGSMSRKGDCWDNAPMESFFGTLKRELIYHERFLTKADARAKIFEYIEAFYNTWRRHTSLGGVCPAEFERTYEQTGNQMTNLPN
jgi:transposase InsO family protein